MIRTVGHGTLPAGAFVDLVRAAGIGVIIDVRRFPGSRRHPHFARDEMERWLPEAGVDYRWVPTLGGRRRSQDPSPNVGLRNASFRAYADHMSTDGFREGVAELRALAAAAPAAVLCAESLWWRCHRRLLADHLVLVDGVAVEHLGHDGRLTPHDVTSAARRRGDHVRYDRLADPTLF